MKNILLSSAVSLMVMIVCDILNVYLLKLKIPDYLVGWFSCTGYYITYISLSYKVVKDE